MDATRYFEEMHRAMAAQKTASQLVLTACYQDTAGSDAYLELRRSRQTAVSAFCTLRWDAAI